MTFKPPLFIQRQGFVLDALRTIKPKSVLDIGCGEGRLLQCLVHCDDGIPAEILAGIDINATALQNASQLIGETAEDEQDGGRWRSLDIRLIHGYCAVVMGWILIFY